MTYTYTGKITWVGALEEGLQGTIKRRVQIVIQDKTTSLAMWVFDDNIEKLLNPVEIGDKITGEFSVKSRQWKPGAKWDTACYCLSMTKVEKRSRQQGHSNGQRKTWGNAYDYVRPGKHQTITKWFTDCKTKQDIKTRYRELCKLHHPDTGGNVKTMQEINVEYDMVKQ